MFDTNQDRICNWKEILLLPFAITNLGYKSITTASFIVFNPHTLDRKKKAFYDFRCIAYGYISYEIPHLTLFG